MLSGALQCSGHLVGLALHPPLHLSDHLTDGQGVAAVHRGPVLTDTALHTHTHTGPGHIWSLVKGCLAILSLAAEQMWWHGLFLSLFKTNHKQIANRMPYKINKVINC